MERTAPGAPRAFFEVAASQSDATACIKWPFSVQTSGYGQVRLGSRVRRVHRLMCETIHGEQPSPKHEAAHSCGEKLCINPHHLRWSTHSENIADKLDHGTHNLGERNQLAKLTEDDARAILDDGRSHVDIAGDYGVHASTIWAIKHRKSWAWLQPV
jgi:hypothetical protein